jgi:hypothetical protein
MESVKRLKEILEEVCLYDGDECAEMILSVC